jgi:IclR family acetate operon transcriptional repressor
MNVSSHAPGSGAAGQPPGAEPLRAYSVMNTVRALERLALRALSAPELAASLQIDERTARRMLRRLAVEGYVDQTGDARRRFRSSLRLAALGRQLVEHNPLLRVCAPSVTALARVTGATAHLWIPSYHDVVCVLHADPTVVAEGPGPMLRELLPAHASAGGKVLLAHRPRWRASLIAHGLARHTARTIVDARDLGAEMDRIRARGYATEEGERGADTASVAAAVFVRDEAVASLGVSVDAAAAQASSVSMDATALGASGRGALVDRVVAAATEVSADLRERDV